MVALGFACGCKKDPFVTSDAGGATPAPTPTRGAIRPPPPASGSAPRAFAGPPPALVVDAGAGTPCRLVYGPVQQSLTGPAALIASARGIEVVQHKNGIAVVNVVPVIPIPAANNPATKPMRIPLQGDAQKASRPACAVAGKYAFCSDGQGNLHRSLREMQNDENLSRALPGGRVTAATMGERTVVGTIQSRRTEANGEQLEAWAKVDSDPPVRISEDGAGASDVVFATLPNGDVLAMMSDARQSMTPVHARVLHYGAKLELGPDVVLHVAGGSTRIVPGELATNEQAAVGLIAVSAEEGFGMISIPIDVPPVHDAPFAFSLYPNGLDGAPIAATRGAKDMIVARVRPTHPPGKTQALKGESVEPYLLELGRLLPKGVFQQMGWVQTSGAITSVAVALDSLGALWLHYTDDAGSWLERRVCQ